MISSPRIIASFILFFLCGAGVASFVFIDITFLFILLGFFLGAAIFLFFFVSRKQQALYVVLFCTAFILGIMRLSVLQDISIRISPERFNVPISFEGVVEHQSIRGKTQRLIVFFGDTSVLILTGLYPQYRYGDTVFVSGEMVQALRTDFYAGRRIDGEMIFPQINHVGFQAPSQMKNMLFSVKEKFLNSIRRVFPDPHSSLVGGMLLGDTGNIPENILNNFRTSGTIHILVLSGYNITLIGVFFLSLFGIIFSLRIAWFSAVAGIIFFTIMTGAEAPAVRAAIMAIIGLLAFRSGRMALPALALLWASFFMVLWNPSVLSYDRGFQLSFLATLGLIVLSPIFEKYLIFIPQILDVRKSVAATLSAQVFVLPLLLSWGNAISLFSPVANLLIVSMVPSVMLFGFVAGVFGMLSPLIGGAIGSVAYVFVSLQIFLAGFFANHGPQILINRIPLFLLIAIYGFILSIAFWSVFQNLAESHSARYE